MATPTAPLPPDAYADHSGPLRAALIVYLVLGLLAVILRFWSRAVATKRSSVETGPRFWWDDWLALIAVPWIVGTIALGLYLVDLGVGKHAAVVPPVQQLQVLKVFFAVSFVYDTSITIVKMSALLFYARVFNAAKTRFRFALWGVMGLVIAWLVGIVFLTIFTCVPVEKAWMPMEPGTCIPYSTTWLASAISSATIDFLILLLPIPLLWRLQMKQSQKALTIGVFLCGYGVVVIALGRVITIYQAGFNLETDLTWSAASPLYWLGAEGPISLFCVCLPSIFFIIRRAIKEGVRSLFSSRYDSKTKLVRDGSATDTTNTSGQTHPHVPTTALPPMPHANDIELQRHKPSASSSGDLSTEWNHPRP